MACNIPAPAVSTCPSDGCYISEGVGHGLTFGLLAVFTVAGGLAIPYIKRMAAKTGAGASDFWYTARNSQAWWSVALSICATSAGAWLLYTPGEAAYNAGWWGVLGYPIAMFLGPLIMSVFASKFREQLPDSANITDWVGHRFGRVVQFYVTIVLIYYMFIYLVSQLKTMGDMTTKFYGAAPEWGIVPVAIFTMVYTMIGGLPASIMTDWIQALAILAFVVIICITLFTEVHFTQGDWREVTKGTDAGFDTFVALCLSVLGAEAFNLAFWQRIYAAKDERQLRIGFLVGAGLVSFITFIFGLSGLLLKANDMRQNRECPPEGSPIVVPAFTFFEVLDMPDTTGFTRTLVFLLAICTITSCADSFQTAITSVISREVLMWELDSTKALLLGEALVIMVNVPAMLFAIHAANDTNATFTGLAVKLTDLFGMADILTITLVVPLFSGLWPFVTTKGCLAGMFSGIFYIVLWGWVEFGTFVAGFSNLTLMCFGVDGVRPEGYSPYTCGPWYSWRSAMLFTTTPLVTFVATFMVSWMENMYTKVSKIYDKVAYKEEPQIHREEPQIQLTM